MRRIAKIKYDAHATQGPAAPMRRIRQGVIGGDARAQAAATLEKLKDQIPRAVLAGLRGTGPAAVETRAALELLEQARRCLTTED
jgi:hypothetical protein